MYNWKQQKAKIGQATNIFGQHHLLFFYPCQIYPGHAKLWKNLQIKMFNELLSFIYFFNVTKVSANKYRSVQELRSSSKLFRYFWFNLFQAVNFDCWEGLVWFGLDRRFEQTENNFFLVCFDWVWFVWLSLVWFGLLIPQTHKQIKYCLILVNLICEFVFGYSTNIKTN